MTADRSSGLAWAFRHLPDAEERAAKFRARFGDEIAEHEARLAAGFGDRVLATADAIVAAESDEPAPPLTAYVFDDGCAGMGAGLTWQLAARRALDWWVVQFLDPELAVDGWDNLDTLDPAAELRAARARYHRVTVQAETSEALLHAVRLLTEGNNELEALLRADLASRPARPSATAHPLLTETRALLDAMGDDPERLRSALRALRCR